MAKQTKPNKFEQTERDMSIDPSIAKRGTSKMLPHIRLLDPTERPRRISVEVINYLKLPKTRQHHVTVGFSQYLGITHNQLWNWMSQDGSGEIEDALDFLKDNFEMNLATRGLNGTYNANMAKFMLSVKHGYVSTLGESTDKDTSDLLEAVLKPRGGKNGK